MSMWSLLMCIGMASFALVGWRLFLMRSKGTAVAVRRLAEGESHGWRHGCIGYTDRDLKYFRLLSLSPRPDKIVQRGEIVISDRRQPTDEEKAIIGDSRRILIIECAGCTYEVAMDTRGETALTSWLESAPSDRLDRVNSSGPLRSTPRSKKVRPRETWRQAPVARGR